MPQNIEIKARLSEEEFLSVLQQSESHSDKSLQILRQKDTFFRSDQGRLKLRQFLNEEGDFVDDGELIFYHRDNQKGPKLSDYSRIVTEDHEPLRLALEQSNGVIGIVEKARQLFFIGQTRVHLDNVKGLGKFVELEVVLTPNQSSEEGVSIADELMERLSIPHANLVETAYIDLLNQAAN